MLQLRFGGLERDTKNQIDVVHVDRDRKLSPSTENTIARDVL